MGVDFDRVLSEKPEGLAHMVPELVVVNLLGSSNLAVIGLQALGWVVFSYVLISFFEHQFHRHLMHRKRFPGPVYRFWPYLLEIFKSHAVCHHGRWYKQFDFEPDPAGREQNLSIRFLETAVMVVCLAPIFGSILVFNPMGGCVVLGVVVAHNRLWNLLHRQMHIPKRVFFRDWAAFHFLARNHFLHHRHTNRNYNVVFPLFDHLFGTVARPNFSEIRELLRLGHLKPRSPAGRAQVARMRTVVAAGRAKAA